MLLLTWAFGAVATRLAVWIAENIENGRAGPIKSDAVAQAFQDVPRGDLDEALAELATDGFVTLTRTMDAGLPRISVTLDLFATFDPVAVGTDPSGDSALLAGFALQIGNGVSAKALRQDWLVHTPLQPSSRPADLANR
jgi:hypothetical protein